MVHYQADIDTTKRMKLALNSIDIHAIDHIIVAGDRYTSFAEISLL